MKNTNKWKFLGNTDYHRAIFLTVLKIGWWKKKWLGEIAKSMEN
jgi:hypothetical protein